MKVHSFNVEEAKLHGVEKAVILYNIRFWLEKNKANDKDRHKHDNHYWTYNSAKAFAKLFPYFNESKIHRLLKQMEDDGLILSSNYNKAAYDRTKWYSMPEFMIADLDNNHFADMENGDCENEECDFADMENGDCRSAGPIPDINTDSKPNINTDICTAKKTPKKLHDIPSDFKPTQKQLDKMIEYGINIKLTLETFKSTHQSNGKRFKDWNAALTTWINKKIEWDKLVPVPQEQKGALDDWNARNPDYQPPSQQPDVYHPSQKGFEDPAPSTLAIGDNGYWKDPLPGKSIAETEQYLKDNKRPGENTYGAYKRLLADLQGGAQ